MMRGGPPRTRVLDDPGDTSSDQGVSDTTDVDMLATERERIKRSLTLAVLAAIRCIPDGEIRNGCVVQDGRQVRERLRSAWKAITDEPGTTDV